MSYLVYCVDSDGVLETYGVFTKKEDAQKQVLLMNQSVEAEIKEVDFDPLLPECNLREKLEVVINGSNYDSFTVRKSKILFNSETMKEDEIRKTGTYTTFSTLKGFAHLMEMVTNAENQETG